MCLTHYKSLTLGEVPLYTSLRWVVAGCQACKLTHEYKTQPWKNCVPSHTLRKALLSLGRCKIQDMQECWMPSSEDVTLKTPWCLMLMRWWKEKCLSMTIVEIVKFWQHILLITILIRLAWPDLSELGVTNKNKKNRQKVDKSMLEYQVVSWLQCSWVMSKKRIIINRILSTVEYLCSHIKKFCEFSN